MRFQLYQPQAISELGSRKNQEDSIYPVKGEATSENRVFLVCDGMGGLDKGEVASAAVRDTMGRATEALLSDERPFDDEEFEEVLEKAYDALDSADVKREAAMGTTMTFLCFHRGGCMVAHIGDSRIYHLRPSLGTKRGVLFRSRDHSLVQQLYELGEISYDAMATSPRKNVILRAMQPYQEQRTKATIAHITDIKPGDYFYLCTDGMLEQMDDDEIMDIVSRDDWSDRQKADYLIQQTVNNADNHSAYLIKVADVENEPADASMPNDESELRAKNKALNDHDKANAWSEDDVEMVEENEGPVQQPAQPSTARPSQPSYAQKQAQPAYRPESGFAQPRTQPKSSMVRNFVLLFIMLVIVLAIGVATWWFFLKPDSPESNRRPHAELTEPAQPQDINGQQTADDTHLAQTTTDEQSAQPIVVNSNGAHVASHQTTTQPTNQPAGGHQQTPEDILFQQTMDEAGVGNNAEEGIEYLRKQQTQQAQESQPQPQHTQQSQQHQAEVMPQITDSEPQKKN